MKEYKVESYTIQRLDNRTLSPMGKKQIMYSVYEKTFTYPNKSKFVWDKVKDGFKTEKQAKEYMIILTKQDQQGQHKTGGIRR